tara:strand:+ start:1163 stop:1405 length:243 start_codon:yes stop_codon:yes gene_type:complete
MFLRLQLLTLNVAIAILLIFFLCLGSQNLSKKYKLNFILNETVSLPIGFLVGSSFTFGIISGGVTSIFMIPKTNHMNDEN